MERPLNFGVFITPFHPVGQSPTVALEYDLDRTVVLDKLGYDEVWFGEHHSGGYELIACPEVRKRGETPATPTGSRCATRSCTSGRTRGRIPKSHARQ